jgi:hypothetical protein
MPRALKWGCFAPILGVIVILCVLWLIDTFLPSADRRALPNTASEVQEYYSDSWNGDFVRLLKARLPESDYESYAKNRGLTQRFDPIAHEDIRSMIEINAADAPYWWGPPPASTKTFFRYERGDHWVQTLSYSHGTVYLLTTSW